MLQHFNAQTPPPSEYSSPNCDTEGQLANALSYRAHRARESDNALIHELLSDIPHARDFLISVKTACIHLLQLNVPEFTKSFAALLFSGGGLAASIPNIRAILHDRKEQITELRSTLKLREHFIQSHSEQDFESEMTLELEGIPDVGIRSLDERQLKTIHDYAFKTRLERLGEHLRAPSLEVIKAGASTTCHFWYATAKDIVLNVSTRLGKNLNCTISGLALWQKCRKEKRELHALAHMRTIKEKIARVETYIDQPDILRILQKDINRIGQPEIDHLDHLQKALRDKAQLLNTANQGFTLQAAFISCSFAAGLLHLGKGHWAEAIFQFSGGSLALNPLRFVGEQAEVLYNALHSERASAVKIEENLLAQLMCFKPDITEPSPSEA